LKISDDTLRVVILSGPICAGKSTVVENLCKRYGARLVKTRDLIKQQLPRVKDERGALQRAGEKLDRADGGAWVKNALARFIEAANEGSTPRGLFVVDSVRIPVQELKTTEKTTTTKRQRRLAEFDWEQLRRSVLLNGPTDIALTFVDYLSIKNREAFRFDQLTLETLRFVEEVERVSGQPVTLISTNFNWRNVIDRRSW